MKDLKYAEDMPVEIIVSDPWDWGTQFGTGPFDATILKWKVGEDGRPSKILLLLKEPVVFEGVECHYFVGERRIQGQHLDDIIHGHDIECSLTRIPDERARSADPFDLGWWRGGVALLCSVRAKRV